MKKKILIISGIVAAVALIVVLSIVIFGNSGKSVKTLEEITISKHGGGPLRYEVDDYTVIEIDFLSNGEKDDEREGTCYVTIRYYKKASYSATGKVSDHVDTKEYPCTFTDYSLTINGVDHYTYYTETRNGREYVVFSKPFFGLKSWYVNK